MKKIFYLFLTLLFISFASCNGSSSNKIDKALDQYEKYVNEYIEKYNSGAILGGLESISGMANLQTDLEYYKKHNEMTSEQEHRYEELTMKTLTGADHMKAIENSIDNLDKATEKAGDLLKKIDSVFGNK